MGPHRSMAPGAPQFIVLTANISVVGRACRRPLSRLAENIADAPFDRGFPDDSIGGDFAFASISGSLARYTYHITATRGGISTFRAVIPVRMAEGQAICSRSNIVSFFRRTLPPWFLARSRLTRLHTVIPVSAFRGILSAARYDQGFPERAGFSPAARFRRRPRRCRRRGVEPN
jgi:hypothetical protein